MKKLIVVASVLFSTLSVPMFAQAHSRLKATVGVQPRSSNDSLKRGPCGTVVKLANSPILNAGEKITVTWEETVNHPGYFEFRFSTDNDVSFSAPVTIPDTATGALPHQYSVELTLPSTTCAQCTLQLVQVMTENPANPSNYYSCADFQLVNGNAPPSTPPPAVSPTPIPGIDSECNMSH